MKNHEFNTVQVTDGSEMELYAAFPQGPGDFPAIIVLQEAFGVTRHIRNIAERLCQEGYAAVAPDLFHRTTHRLEAPYTDFSAVMPHFQAVSEQGLRNDLEASYDWLQKQDHILTNKIGSIGFCLGGRVSFLANAVLPLKAAVSYYGGGLDELTGKAAHLHGDQLFYWGGLDKHIRPDKIDTIIKAVDEAGKAYINVLISYADHGFNCDERNSYHPLAAKESWALTLTFFSNRLK
jgi:carboxymethylenebutenolidase